MKRKTEIEATLDRSLRRQVKLPTLDTRFDAAVWARIEAEESRKAVGALPMPAAVPRSAQWLRIFNVVGIAGLAIFASFFGAQMLAGADVAISMPEISAAEGELILNVVSMSIAGASLLFGLLFTPWGRRLRDELI